MSPALVAELNASVHACSRLQSRAIPAFVIDLLYRLGASVRCEGAERLFFDGRSRKALRGALGGKRGMRTIEPWLNVYAVVGDNGRLVTAAHRTKRMPHR